MWMTGSGLGVHSDGVEWQQLSAKFRAALPSNHSGVAHTQCSPQSFRLYPHEGIKLWHHWGSETKTHLRLPPSSGCPSRSTRCPSDSGDLWTRQSHSSPAHCVASSAVCLTPVQVSSGHARAFLPSLPISRGQQ